MMKIEIGSTAFAMPLAGLAAGHEFRGLAAKHAQLAFGKDIDTLAAARASLAQRNLDLTLGLGKAVQDYLA